MDRADRETGFHVEEQCNINGEARKFKLCSGSGKKKPSLDGT